MQQRLLLGLLPVRILLKPAHQASEQVMTLFQNQPRLPKVTIWLDFAVLQKKQPTAANRKVPLLIVRRSPSRATTRGTMEAPSAAPNP